jgi:uncharacterized protein (TIGR02001 family)
MRKTINMLAAIALPIAMTTAQAEVSANLGFNSDYIFRGVPQAESSANGGVDLETSGLYLGTWAAAVKPGLEVDVYGGYRHQWDNGLNLGAGFTGYYYTDDFDDTYKEINLYAGYKMVSVEYASGQWDAFNDPTADYDYLAVRVEYSGFYGKFGSWGKDFDGNYFELGYGQDVAGFDLGVHLIRSSKELSGNLDSNFLPTEDTFFVFSISKSFDLMD